MSTGNINYQEIGNVKRELEEELEKYELLSPSRNQRIALIDIFNEALLAMEQAEIYARNIDKMLDGDISEENLICRVRRELAKIKINKFV